MRDADCVELLQWALPRLGLRWRGFSNLRGQVCKRIGRRMRELGLDDAHAYRARLEGDPAEWARLDGFCRVTISRFYRDRGVFDALTEQFLPALARIAADEARPLRLWSAGCASGEEPWTLALALRMGPASETRARWEIVATDVDEVLLDRAREASYPRGTLREMPAAWRDSAFEPTDGELRLRDALRGGVEFRLEDIRSSMPEGRFDLVLCRNLAFTYFDVPLQERVLAGIVERLWPRGLLVIGGHERLPPAAEAMGFVPAAGALPIFARADGPGR